MKICRFLALIAATAPFAAGQLYLLGGTPPQDGSYRGTSAALFRVGDDGSIKRTLTLVEAPRWEDDPRGKDLPKKDKPGLEWIGIAYEWRKLVLLTAFPDGALIVVDFDKASVVKRCSDADAPGDHLPEEWFADAPGHGPSFEWADSTPGDTSGLPNRIRGLVLDPSVPCSRSIFPLTPEDIKGAITHGWGGGLAAYASGHLGVGLDQTTGSLFYVVNRRIPLDYKVPADLLRGFDRAEIGIDDSHVLELCLIGKNGAYRDLILRKSDHTWHTLPLALERPTYTRGFGRYLALTEVQTASAKHPTSPGKEELRTAPSELGPGSWVIEQGGHVLPGNLYIYDSDTERIFTINTHQGDSEVLLIEGGTVYWRAARRLYSAPLTDSGVGQPRILANDEMILDTHYAFIKR